VDERLEVVPTHPESPRARAHELRGAPRASPDLSSRAPTSVVISPEVGVLGFGLRVEDPGARDLSFELRVGHAGARDPSSGPSGWAYRRSRSPQPAPGTWTPHPLILCRWGPSHPFAWPGSVRRRPPRASPNTTTDPPKSTPTTPRALELQIRGGQPGARSSAPRPPGSFTRSSKFRSRAPGSSTRSPAARISGEVTRSWGRRSRTPPGTSRRACPRPA
jgi:hypothetical protein